MELKELHEELGKVTKLMRENADRMHEQDTRLKDVESLHKETDERLQGRISELEDEIKRLETEAKRSPRVVDAEGKEVPEERVEHRKAFIEWIRKGEDQNLRDLEQKALSVQSDPDGGYFVTPEVSSRIATKLFETSPVRQFAFQQTIGTDALEGTADTDEASGGGWVAETGSRAATTTPTIDKWRIPVHEQYEMPEATQKLLDDANINAEQWLGDKVADKLARRQNAAFVTGDGNGKPRGFMTYAAGTSWGQIEQVNSGSSGAVQADQLIDLVYSLKTAYRQNASFFMNRSLVQEVRKLKDSNNQYHWAPGLAAGQPSTLLGYPIGEFEDMADAAADSLSIAFGDLRATYTIVDRAGTRVLRDPFTNKPYVRFYTTVRVGGDVVNFEALKIQKLAA